LPVAIPAAESTTSRAADASVSFNQRKLVGMEDGPVTDLPVSTTEPTAVGGVARLVLAGLEKAGGGYAALARQAGVPADGLVGNSARVPTECLVRLWRLGLFETDEPYLGFKVANQWRFGQLDLTDYLFQTAPTLGDAITGMVRFSALLNTAANDVWLTEGERGGMTVTYQIRSGDPEVDAMASQFALGTVLMRARYAVRREIRPLHLGLTSSAPRRHYGLADMSGARRIDFGAESSTVTLAFADLSLPLPDANAALEAVLEDHAADMIAAQRGTGRWTDRVRPFVAANLASDGLSLPEAARRFAMSPRTLQRRLTEEGTNWWDVVDGVRRDRATVLLTRGLSRAAVAARLGFSDARALRAALHRWERDADG
jgi:AraC-like DNA-binding protein